MNEDDLMEDFPPLAQPNPKGTTATPVENLDTDTVPKTNTAAVE